MMEINLLFHMMGFGFLSTTLIGGGILEVQFRRTKEESTKVIISRSMKAIGLLSPIAILVLLVTGIINMSLNHFTLLQLPGWLAFKIVFFTLLIINGVLFAIQSRKRNILLQKVSEGEASNTVTGILLGIQKQITLFYVVLALLILLILYLSITGVTGAQ